MSPRWSPGEGDVLAGKYRLVRVLGEGGMGRVFLAQRVDLGGHVAIKILREDDEVPETSVERLRREAQATSRLKSESVVRVLDMGTDRGTPFIVMEHVVGKTLAQHLSTEGPMDPIRAVDIVVEVCAVLAEAHARGIVHRDIKASNVALTKRPDGTDLVKVLDFGIAKQTTARLSSLTETATVLGSPKYMSPEQIRDARSVGPEGDLWSLTVLLQEILTGSLPFEAFTVPGLLAKIVADPPTPARSVRPDLPASLEDILLRALAKEPSRRFADAAELAEALAPFASAEGARRAARVRPIFLHARAATPSESPPPDERPETSDRTELDLTSAPTAREHPVRSERAPPRRLRHLRALGLLSLPLSLALATLAWRARPDPVGVSSSSTPSASPAVRSTMESSESPPAPLSSPFATRATAAPLALSSALAAPAETSTPPSAAIASSARPASSSMNPVPRGPLPPRRHGAAGPSALAPRAAPSDDDFGPRQ